MQIGDVVTYRDQLWQVVSPRHGRLFALRTWEGEEHEVPELYDVHPPDSGLKVVAKAGSWPFVSAPFRTKDGPIRQVLRHGKELLPLIDWTPGVALRPGGPVYLNPALGLKRGEVLVAVHQRGFRVRLSINGGLLNVRQRHAKANPPTPVKRTVYDRMDRGLFDDD